MTSSRLAVTLLAVTVPVAALAGPADVNGDGLDDVADVQCAIVTVLAGLDGAAPPPCLAGPPSLADLNCSGAVDVVDVVVAIKVVLGSPFPPGKDADGDGWLDACDPHVGFECPVVAAPEPVVDPPIAAMAPGQAGTTTGAFTDDWLLDGTGLVRVATRREWGATIVGFGLAAGGAGANTIDANDTGREVQVAFYDATRIMQGCAWNASCQSTPGAACPSSITYLGWNPVQGGNECNNGSGVEWVTTEPGRLRASVRPLFWNPDWELQTCGNGGCSDPAKKALPSDVRYTQTLRFVDPLVLEVEMRVDNLAAIDHPVAHQEFPTVYASYGAGGTPDLRDLLDASGAAVPIDVPANDGFFYKQFVSPGPFVTLQNTSHDYGVGMLYENRLSEFQGWQKKGVFNNFRAVFPFGIPANGTVVGRAYLILGSFATIKAKAAWLDQALGPFGHLEAPAPDAAVDPDAGQTLPIGGWALDNLSVAHVEVRVDGAPVATLPVTGGRPDVCAQHPGYAACPVAGFSGAVDVSQLTPCAHLLEVRAVDGHGNARVLGRRRFVVGPPPPCLDDASCEDGDPCTVDSCGAEGCAHAPAPAGSGPAEACNGADDDCDGAVDEGDVCAPKTHAVYRYYQPTAGQTDHMYGLSPTAPAGYVAEGPQLTLFDAEGPGLVPLWQTWCASCTDHLQSTSPTEGAPSFGGAELLGWCSAQSSAQAGKPLRRLHSAAASDHFVSASPDEWAAAQAVGYVLEGVLCHVP